MLQVATLSFNAPPRFAKLAASRSFIMDAAAPAASVLSHLQTLPPVDGYVHREFSLSGGSGRLFFSEANARMIDAIKGRVADWCSQSLLDPDEEAYLRATLILAADRVANTAGTYYAHLKTLGRKALKPIELKLPPTTASGASGGCHNADALTVVEATETDVLYLDPPYNERDYAGYYHLPETLAWGDAPVATGRSGVPRARTEKSRFYRTAQAANALSQIIAKAKARHIVVHYTTEGIIPHNRIVDSLGGRGRVRFEDRSVRSYTSRSSDGAKKAWHRLYWCDVEPEGARDESPEP